MGASSYVDKIGELTNLEVGVIAKLGKYLLAIIGALVTISLSLISDFVLKLPKEITWLTFSIGAIITVTITLLEQKLLDSVSDEISRKIELYQILGKIEDPELYQLALNTISESIEKLRNYEQGIVPSTEHSYISSRLSKCKKIYQATFWAATIQSLYNVEDRSSAVNYYEANFEAVKRGIKVERIFLLSKDDVLETDGKFANQKALRIISRQQSEGINVRIIWLESLKDIVASSELYQDIAIIDEKEVSVQLHGVGNSRPGILLVKRESKVRDYQKIYEKLWKLSRPLNDVLEQHPASNTVLSG